MKLKTIILAAGQGTRMKSKKPKVLHEVAGLPMAEHVIRLAAQAGDSMPTLVVGHGAEEVRAALSHCHVAFALQEEQRGTGHAVMCATSQIPKDSQVLVLCGDTPLVTQETLKGFLDWHETAGNQLSVLSMRLKDPTGYGRMVRNPAGCLVAIVEQRDADPAQARIDEVNSGIYLMDGALLLQHIGELRSENAQKEFYLTDMVEIFLRRGYNVDAHCADSPDELLGINNRVQLAHANAVMRERINRHWMLEGVTLIDPSQTDIGPDVRIGMDTVIHPGTALRGTTVVGEDCILGPRTVIENSVIGNAVHIRESQVLNSAVKDRTTVGPYAYLRPGSEIGTDVKIGDFVEIKNSKIGDGTKISHLTYVGDADVGKSVNLGCGVVFVNYDGVSKYRTVVGDRAFIGCNVNLVAPVEVQSGAYVAAGTTVTVTVPQDALAIGREKQRNIEGWVSRKRGKR